MAARTEFATSCLRALIVTAAKWTLSEAQFWQRLRKRLPATQFNRVREAAKVMKREVRRRLRERN